MNRSIAAFALTLLLTGCAGEQAAAPAQAPVAPPVAASAAPVGPWTAEISVKLSGCTSCADCRAGIRQVSQTRSGTDRVTFEDGISRMVYPAPAPIRVLEAAQGLSGDALPKVHVDRVELKVAGRSEVRDGGAVFVVFSTGQSWPLAAGKVEVPPGASCVLDAVVEGWREGTGPVRLKPRTVQLLSP